MVLVSLITQGRKKFAIRGNLVIGKVSQQCCFVEAVDSEGTCESVFHSASPCFFLRHIFTVTGQELVFDTIRWKTVHRSRL